MLLQGLVTPLRTAIAGTVLLAACSFAAPGEAQSLLPGTTWSGPYWGVHAGGAWADLKGDDRTSRLAWGGHLGYGLQLSAFYLGIEGDGTWGGASGTSELTPLYSADLTVDWAASARARAGLVAGGLLFYVTGGVAWSGQTLGLHRLGSELSSDTSIVRGHVLGAGIEAKLLPFVSLRLEAQHYDFADQSSRFLPSLPAGLATGSLKGLDLDQTVVRAGVTLRMN